MSGYETTNNENNVDEFPACQKTFTTVPKSVFREEYLSKGDFVELKALAYPPQAVKEVMHCFGILGQGYLSLSTSYSVFLERKFAIRDQENSSKI